MQLHTGSNGEETINVADTAAIGGESDLSLNEQQDFGGRCRGGRGFGSHPGGSDSWTQQI
jgi:hypothetical protein